MKKQLCRIALGVAAVALSVSFLYAHSLMDYRFKVHNKSNSKIVKLLASPDGLYRRLCLRQFGAAGPARSRRLAQAT